MPSYGSGRLMLMDDFKYPLGSLSLEGKSCQHEATGTSLG